MSGGRTTAASALLLAAIPVLGCALPRQMLASSDDLADYREFRMGEHEGRRLAAAQRYLELHPDGAWASEVRAAFDAEEPAWFEAAKYSRARAREYIVDLPHGPHVDAARALLVLFDEHESDVETLTLLAQARRTSATLDYESARRRHVSDLLLSEISALLDPSTWGARLDSPPAALGAVLRGEGRSTWGGEARPRRADHLFFVVPTPQGAQAHDLEVALDVVLDRGRVVQGTVHGEDLFVRWAEAIVVRVLDPNQRADRALAAATVADVLAGAAEAALPQSRCAVAPKDGEIFDRACDGWSVSARMGTEAGEEDLVDVVGSTRKE